MSVWGIVELEPGEERAISIGELDLQFRRTAEEWRLGLFGNPVTAGGAVPGWRSIPALGNTRPNLVPATPDLPVVLKPANPIALVPGATVHYKLTLPIWIKLIVTGKRGREVTTETLADLPSHLIKRTWFGTVEAGEVAYGWRFSPQTDHANRAVRRDEFSVPLTIKNRSDAVLWFERLMLRVVHLDLYQADGGIVSNSVTVNYKGLEQYSQITWGDGRSMIKSGFHKISGCREVASNDIIRKSFIWLRDLTA
ncbi:MAG: hypothetical protein EA427_14080 [Spirochaetaceae bacterium]|nr:MAG: hypothetical protein EA427_14080 [Spirochaetaceae bacterium]